MAINQKQAVKEFVERWKAEEGNEDRQSRSFWIELAGDVLGVDNPTHVLEFERKAQGRKMDVFYEDMGILIEQKSRGVDLDKKSERSKKAGEEAPYQQAKWYADHLPNSVRPDWIIVSNFDEFRIHNLDSDDPEHDYVSLTLDELPDQLHLLSFFTDKSSSRLVKEKELSVKAGEIVGKLYKSLAGQYKNIATDKNEQRSLNILIVRFVFLLYAEDAGILQEHQAFLNYMKKVEPEDMRTALIQLFQVLDTPEDQRDPYLPEKLAAFPYINGSLFAEENIVIPQFTQQIKYDLLKEASQEFDWSGISPTIFGAAFESTLNPDTRREGGMHYTSIENIHKVIDPLFLDDLNAELAKIEGLKVEKTRNLQLRQFQNKLASLKIFDPACGSGNFLTESYLSLRKLENRVLENLMGDQMGMGFTGSDSDPIKVSIDQLYGIEINDFAVAVTKTALWIAEEQMMDVTQEILLMSLNFLPLTSNNNIHEANALRMDWNEVLPAKECNYIIGNPPFVGFKFASTIQKEDLRELFGKEAKLLDYVCGWYKKAALFIQNSNTHVAFVSTNSVSQGKMAADLWYELMTNDNIVIEFAYRTFVWNNEAAGQAHVHCVIIGFTTRESARKDKMIYEGSGCEIAENINCYLLNQPNVFIMSRSKPINSVPELVMGNQAMDNGNLIIEEADYADFIANEPDVLPYIKRYMMGNEFINNKNRWCLWLDGCTSREIEAMPLVAERVNNVREFRSASNDAGARKKASTPHLFREQRNPDEYVAVPITSSERRDYVPIGFLDKTVIAGNTLFILEDASLYHFGVMTSKAHNVWMRTVGARMKSDYRYSKDIVYNNFIWPNPTPEQKHNIEQLAQRILDIRDSYPSKSLASLYDPDKMPNDLLEAHKALDKAVEEAYGVDFNGDEEKIASHLFKLYAEATKE